MKTCILKTNFLRGKKVVREIEAPENFSLYRLAEAIIGAHDFYFDCAFWFFCKIRASGDFKSEKQYEIFTDLIEEGEDLEPTGAKSVKKTKVAEVWKNPGDKMLFLFDYGDNWLFTVELIGFGKKEAKTKYPRILKSAGKAPKQYPDYNEE